MKDFFFSDVLMNLCDCVKWVKKNKCYFYSLFFFPGVMNSWKQIHSDFQCCAQISFSRFRDQCHIVLNHFLKLPKKKKVAFYFSYLPLCSICVLNLKGQHCVCVRVCARMVGVYTVQRTKLKLFCINLQFWTIRSVSFAVWPRLLLRPLRDRTSCLSCLPNVFPSPLSDSLKKKKP